MEWKLFTNHALLNTVEMFIFCSASALPDMDDPFDELRGSNTRFMDKDPVRKIKTPAAVREEEPRSNDWLESVSRKAGIPRWLLLSSVFLCSLMFVWLCFAATGPVPEQRVYAISNMPPAYSCKQVIRKTFWPFPANTAESNCFIAFALSSVPAVERDPLHHPSRENRDRQSQRRRREG